MHTGGEIGFHLGDQRVALGLGQFATVHFLPQGGTYFEFAQVADGRLAAAGIHNGHRVSGTRYRQIKLQQDAGVEVAHQKRSARSSSRIACESGSARFPNNARWRARKSGLAVAVCDFSSSCSKDLRRLRKRTKS